MVKKRSLDFMDQLEQEFPELLELNTDKKEVIKAIPTGSISLDVSIGVRGIPMSKYTEIYGAEGSGKTTLALSICKNAIRLGHRVLYNDAEHGLDLARVEQILGEDAYNKDKFLVMQPELMEDALRISELAIQSKKFGLIILDSIASMTPKKVKEGDLDDSNVALLARRFGIFLGRNAHDVYKNDIAFVGLNQVRDKFGAYMPTYDVPGGHQWKHMTSVRIALSKMSDIVKDTEKVGIVVKFVVKKNKLSPPFRTYTFPIMFDSGVDELRDLVEFSSTMGVLVKSGPYYKFGDVPLANGVVNTIEYLKNNPETLDKVKEQCYNITKQLVIEEEKGDEYEQESED